MATPVMLEALSRPQGRDRMLLLALVGFWALFVLLYTARAMLLGTEPVLQGLPRRLLVAGVGAALAWAIHLGLKRFARAGIGHQIALVLAMGAPAGVLFSATNAATFLWLAPLSGLTCLDGAPCTWAYLRIVTLDYAISWTFIFIAWGVICLWLETLAAALAAERRGALSRDAARLAEIRALRYQVNPHFLFNCLNSLSALIGRTSPRDAQAMVGELAAFVRESLASEIEDEIELEREIDLLRRYLALEQRRFGDRLQVIIAVAPELSTVRVPSLLLQPLVENVITHGVARSREPVTLTLTIDRTDEGGVRTTVADDARTDTADVANPPDRQGLGLGLRNSSERLALRYGDRAALEAGPRPGCDDPPAQRCGQCGAGVMSGRPTAVIIDDEPLAIEGLSKLIAEDGRVTVVGEARDGTAGLALVDHVRPEIVFLDISMPGLGGLAVAERLKTATAVRKVVLVSAHDHYATEAFDLGIVDYVLKPVQSDRLSRAIDRLLARSAPPARGFWAPWRGGLVWVPEGRILRIEAEGDYSRLVCSERAPLIRAALSDIEARLDPARFVRIHRSKIVRT